MLFASHFITASDMNGTFDTQVLAKWGRSNKKFHPHALDIITYFDKFHAPDVQGTPLNENKP
jgi:hypothetical protein